MPANAVRYLSADKTRHHRENGHIEEMPPVPQIVRAALTDGNADPRTSCVVIFHLRRKVHQRYLLNIEEIVPRC